MVPRAPTLLKNWIFFIASLQAMAAWLATEVSLGRFLNELLYDN